MKYYNGLTPREAEFLAILAEECGEVIQAVDKILRHGYDTTYPSGAISTNRDDLEREVADIQAIVVLMGEECDLDTNVINRYKREKLAKICKYLHHKD